MGKKEQKKSSISAKDNACWLRSFISIFEFSQRYNPRKLLADRKRGSARFHGTNFFGTNLSEDNWERKYEHEADVDGCEYLSRLPSVKTLMEEEMSSERTTKAPGNFKSNQMMTEKQKNDSDPRISNLLDSAYVVLEQFKCREPYKGSNLIFDLASLMIEFYSVSRNCSDMCEEIEADLCSPLKSSGHRKHTNLGESDSQLAYRRTMLQEALVIEAEAFLSQKIDDTKRLVGNGVICSQEFIDALEIMNSNKELFLKLVQDPNSSVFNHIQELLKPQVADFSELEAVHCLKGSDHLDEEPENSDQDGKSISNQMFQKHKRHFFSKQKSNFGGEIASKTRKSSSEISKIVVLKPQVSRKHDDSIQNSPCLSSQSCYSKKNEKDSERTVSNFSFRHIKRKLRYLIGESKKGKNLISKDSLGRILLGYKVSTDTYSMTSTEISNTHFTSQTDCSTENICQSLTSNSKADKKFKAKEWQQKVEGETSRSKIQGLTPVSLCHTKSFNEEAEKYFSEMMSTAYRTSNSTEKRFSKSLEKMFSPSDCNQLLLTDETSATLSPEQSFKESPLFSSDLDVEMPLINTEAANDKVGLPEETYIGEQPNTEGREGIVEIENIKSVHTNSAECSTMYIPDGSSCESCYDGCSTPSEKGTPIEKSRILIPAASTYPSSLTINNFESSEFIMEKPEKPSPVSVLEPFFLEDDASPDRPTTKFDDLTKPLRPIHLNFHEDSTIVITTSDCLMAHQSTCSHDMEIMTKYVRTMLETCSFDSETSPERWPSSGLLLQPSPLDKRNALQSSYPEDPNLLLDCVKEVLSEIRIRRFQISPWVPILEDFIIQEVCKTIKSYTSLQAQSTINEMMWKDMGSTTWTEQRSEMECISAEMVCKIFDELMEEIVFELFM